MPGHSVLFSADLHGSKQQYQQLVEFALSNPIDSVVIGGDICPKTFLPEDKERFIYLQGSFLDTILPALLSPLKERGIETYLIMGNDDAKINLPILHKRSRGIYHVIHSRRRRLTPDFEIVGYPYVSITPFGIKDWEKYEFSEIPDYCRNELAKRKLAEYRLKGVKSSHEGWEPFLFKEGMAKYESIQKDLNRHVYVKSPRNTVYVMHAPPTHTHLDQVARGHVGSLAIRDFIEENQPYLTLHGHIHETVKLSGSFMEKLKGTTSIAAGNLEGDGLSMIVLDLYDPRKAERVVIPHREGTKTFLEQ